MKILLVLVSSTLYFHLGDGQSTSGATENWRLQTCRKPNDPTNVKLFVIIMDNCDITSVGSCSDRLIELGLLESVCSVSVSSDGAESTYTCNISDRYTGSVCCQLQVGDMSSTSCSPVETTTPTPSSTIPPDISATVSTGATVSTRSTPTPSSDGPGKEPMPIGISIGVFGTVTLAALIVGSLIALLIYYFKYYKCRATDTGEGNQMASDKEMPFNGTLGGPPLPTLQRSGDDAEKSSGEEAQTDSDDVEDYSYSGEDGYDFTEQSDKEAASDHTMKLQKPTEPHVHEEKGDKSTELRRRRNPRVRQETEEPGIRDNIGDDRASTDNVCAADEHTDLCHPFKASVDIDVLNVCELEFDTTSTKESCDNDSNSSEAIEQYYVKKWCTHGTIAEYGNKSH